jgi:hypothetical protein
MVRKMSTGNLVNKKTAKIIPKISRIIPESPPVNSKDRNAIRKIIDSTIKPPKISFVDWCRLTSLRAIPTTAIAGTTNMVIRNKNPLFLTLKKALFIFYTSCFLN